MDWQATFRVALEHHRRGQWGEAESVCRQILVDQPRDSNALNLLGVVLHQQGRSDEGIVALCRATEVAPTDVNAWNNLATVLRGAGRLEEALLALTKATALAPNSVSVWTNLARTLVQAHKLSEALEVMRHVLALNPSDETTSAAVRTLEMELERRNLAERWQATQRDRGVADAGVAGATDANAAEETRGADPILVFSFSELLDRAIAGPTDEAVRRMRRGLRAWDEGDFESARALIRAALEERPDLAVADVWLAFDDLFAGRRAEAQERCSRVLRQHPDWDVARVADATMRLTLGDMSAWGDYASAVRGRSTPPVPDAAPSWQGESLEGQRILVFAESADGFGDIFQFIRYLALLRRRGAHVIGAMPRAMLNILAGFADVDELIDRAASWPVHDYQCPLFRLPALLSPTLDQIPAEIPYLTPPAARCAVWREWLGDRRGAIRVGLAWQGSQPHRNDNRSFPLKALTQLAEVAGVEFYSLQMGPGAEQIGDWDVAPRLVEFGADFDRDHGRFCDTAAVMAQLDLVICCDSSVGHLAGALGRPVWFGLPYASDFRWLLQRRDSPWYPTARLFRQRTSGDWNGVVREMRNALTVLVASRAAN